MDKSDGPGHIAQDAERCDSSQASDDQADTPQGFGQDYKDGNGCGDVHRLGELLVSSEKTTERVNGFETTGVRN
jgi:hypothetical protein